MFLALCNFGWKKLIVINILEGGVNEKTDVWKKWIYGKKKKA